MKSKKLSDLSVIKNITNLNQLAEFDDNIRAYAKMKIKNDYLADDIVGDTYVKLFDIMSGGKVINGGYVIMTINSIWLNKLKVENRYGDECEFEMIDNIEEVMAEELVIQEQFDTFQGMLNELPLFERLLFRYTRIMTLMEISKRSKISYNTIRNSNNIVKDKLGLRKKTE
jgi:DNA-directed RNA polymerase specialized sigma24 family protein